MFPTTDEQQLDTPRRFGRAGVKVDILKLKEPGGVNQ